MSSVRNEFHVLGFKWTFKDLYNAINGPERIIIASNLPIPITFKKPIFEDDFVEKGMVAYFTDIEQYKEGVLEVHFYFDPRLLVWNKQFLKRAFHHKQEKGNLTKSLKAVTALESGDYEEHYSVYVDEMSNVSDYLSEVFNKRIFDLVMAPVPV